MCDTEACKSSLKNIMDNYIPRILPQLGDYVVKGGRASDYYISKLSGKKPATYTDWDIACKTERLQSQICDQIIRNLNNFGFTDIKRTSIVAKDRKKGLQLGVQCNEDVCYFVDIVVYGPDDPAFINIQTSDDGIKYISEEYLLTDLEATYQDRINDLKSWLGNLHITDIDPENLSNENYNDILESIKKTLIQFLDDKFSLDISDIDDDDDFSQKEKDEDKQDLKKRYTDDIDEINTITIPQLKDRFEKLIRTKIRYTLLTGTRDIGKLKDTGELKAARGGKKTKTKSKSKSRRKNKKRMTRKTRRAKR